MNAQLDREVHNSLVLYLGGKLRLDEFKDRFTQVTWDAERGGLVHESELASEIEHRLAELSNGDWTEEEFRGLVEPMVATVTTVLKVGAAAAAADGSSSNSTITTVIVPAHPGEAIPRLTFGTPIVAASV